MTPSHAPDGRHDHIFLGHHHTHNERKVWWVIGLTALMMAVEIVAGTLYGSMALVADGWHMCTHAGALLIAALAYRIARRNANNPRFTFGTGKIGDLAGFGSAVILGLISLLIAWESLDRLANPVAIDFGQAMLVAAIGLAVNLLSAWMLRDDHAHHMHGHDQGHSHHHAHDHLHDHGDHLPAQDNNLRAAYLHVIADALTSVLAIVALGAGSSFGWIWLDPATGMLGAVVIARWSWGLIRQSGAVLIDYLPLKETVEDEIREAIETPTDRITDLHIWQLGPGHRGVIIALDSDRPESPSTYRRRLTHLGGLSHVTIEVEPARK